MTGADPILSRHTRPTKRDESLRVRRAQTLHKLKFHAFVLLLLVPDLGLSRKSFLMALD
jgi:hypothetical protein